MSWARRAEKNVEKLEAPITPINLSTDRRASAPHPGPRLKREYFDALELDIAEFARSIGVDQRRLGDMLDGRESFDVDTAIRLSRAFQISADAIMRMQLRADFSVARGTLAYDAISILKPPSDVPFPEASALRGRLGLSVDTAGDPSYYFQEEISLAKRSNHYAGLHALFRGDRLRVHREDGTIRWTGVLLNGLDGRLHLPYVPASEWPTWFDDRCVAELAIGQEHSAFFIRMGQL